MPQVFIDSRTGRTPMELLLKGSMAIFQGNIKTLKSRMVNRSRTVRRQYGAEAVPRDIVYQVLEDLVYEMQLHIDKMKGGF